MAPAESEFRRFRPRQVRVVGIGGAIAVFGGFLVLSISLFTVDWKPWAPVDMVWMNVLGIVIAAALLRFADIQARPAQDGLVVKNLIRTKHFAWTEILGATFSADGDDPWVLLDLSDGSSYPVMAIQQADGPRAHAECARLRMLIDKWTHIKEDQE